jgi:mannose-6-phosphate isomerase
MRIERPSTIGAESGRAAIEPEIVPVLIAFTLWRSRFTLSSNARFTSTLKPIVLPPNQPPRFYRGGSAIARFRGLEPGGEFAPEDWLGATNPLAGSDTRGLTVLPDGRVLRDAIAAEPESFLGAAHVDRFGSDPRLLVKLLDAAERLPVHSHPDDAFAQERLAARHGKSEAWLILAGGTIHLGFREDVEANVLLAWVARQDVDAMLGALNEQRVAPGDCVFVPATVPHAIGAGVFMVEVQQASDLSLLLEWRRLGLERDDAALGLDFDEVLGAVRLAAVRDDELEAWTIHRKSAHSLVPGEAARFFRAERVVGGDGLEPGYAILVVVEGAGALVSEAGKLEVKRGDTILVPFAAGAAELRGDVEALRCRPPAT